MLECELTRLGAATALQVTVAVVGSTEAITTAFARSDRIVSFTSKPSAFAERNVVRSSDTLVSPRHIDNMARLRDEVKETKVVQGWKRMN